MLIFCDSQILTETAMLISLWRPIVPLNCGEIWEQTKKLIENSKTSRTLVILWIVQLRSVRLDRYVDRNMSCVYFSIYHIFFSFFSLHLLISILTENWMSLFPFAQMVIPNVLIARFSLQQWKTSGKNLQMLSKKWRSTWEHIDSNLKRKRTTRFTGPWLPELVTLT